GTRDRGNALSGKSQNLRGRKTCKRARDCTALLTFRQRPCITETSLLDIGFSTWFPCCQPIQKCVECIGVRYPGIFSGRSTPPADSNRKSLTLYRGECVEIRTIVPKIDRHTMTGPWA